MDKTRAGYIEGVVSIVINTVLFVLKLWAGIVTGSLALTADAWHTLSDSFSSVVVVIAAKLASLKPDKEHPFGHGRWEQIAALFIGAILAMIAFGFLKDSVIQFSNKVSTQFGTLAIVVTIISIVVKEGLAQYAFILGRKTQNMTVKADGWHHRSDALSSVVVLIGILMAKKFWWIDSVLGFIIAIMLFYAAYQIIKDAVLVLLGEQPHSELVDGITAMIRERYNDDLKPHHFHIHNYITHKELTFHIKLKNELSIVSGHKIATDIENKVFENYQITATVHVEPMDFEHGRD